MHNALFGSGARQCLRSCPAHHLCALYANCVKHRSWPTRGTTRLESSLSALLAVCVARHMDCFGGPHTCRCCRRRRVLLGRSSYLVAVLVPLCSRGRVFTAGRLSLSNRLAPCPSWSTACSNHTPSTLCLSSVSDVRIMWLIRSFYCNLGWTTRLVQGKNAFVKKRARRLSSAVGGRVEGIARTPHLRTMSHQ